MLGCKDPSSSLNGLTYQSPSLGRIFSSRIIPTTMQWSYLVSSRDFWSTMSWWTHTVQRISFLRRLSDKCKSRTTRYMMQHTPFVVSEEDRFVALGKITMPVTFGYVHKQVVFDIVDMEYSYNAIIGQGTLNTFEAILHPAYLCMKIPSEQGPIMVHGSQEAARRAERSWTDSKAIHNIDEAEAHQQYKHKSEKAASVDQPKSMLLCEDIAEQKVLLGSQLSDEQEKTLLRFLFNNKDVFAWSANDLFGVNRDIIEHSLNVDPSFRPRKQRLQKMSDDKAEGARNKVKRLLSVGVIREVTYLEWLANTVMVKKANGKWRMCIDFTNLNKACPKDEFPLPRIDSLVDAAATSELMSLLDCYSGYHRIWMRKDDEPKTSFITPIGTYCYLRMPKGLKNARGSFSRMTAKVLHSQIGKNVLTYVDDIIVKSTE
jgi:hypothetical protein